MKPPDMEHTFVVLAYGESEYLESCICSLLKQTVPSAIHVVTSSPNLHITSIAAKYKLEVKPNPSGGSIGKDWNFGLRTASTKYVTLTHQDDLYLPRFVEAGIKLLNQYFYSKPLIAFNRSVVYKGEHEIRLSYKNLIRWLLIFPFHFKRCISSECIKKSISLFSNPISCPGVMYVRENLQDFCFEVDKKYVLDWKAWIDLSNQQGAFVYVAEALHIHREHNKSATSATNNKILQQEELDLLQYIWGNRYIAKVITGLLRLTK